MKPFLILVAGGSASGKSTVVKEIIKKAGLKDVIIIKHDDYYHDQKELSFEEKLNQNYDHPNSLDNELLVKHIKDLISEKTVDERIVKALRNKIDIANEIMGEELVDWIK